MSNTNMDVDDRSGKSVYYFHSVIMLIIFLCSAYGVMFAEHISTIERKLSATFSMFVNYKLKDNEYLCITPIKDDEGEYKSLCEGAKLASFLSAEKSDLKIELTTLEYRFNDAQIVDYIEKANVVGIIGLDIDSFTEELRSYIKEKNIPILSPLEYGFSNSVEAYEYQLYLGLDVYSSIRSILTFAKNVLLVDNIIYVSKRNHFASVQKKILRDSLKDFDIEQGGDIEVPSEVTDHDLQKIVGAIVSKVAKSGNPFLYVSTSQEFALKLENLLRKSGVRVPIILNGKNSIDHIEKFVGSSVWGNSSASTTTTDDILNWASSASDLYVAEPFDYDAAGQISDTFRSRYKEIFGHLPVKTAAYGYDAVNYFNKMIQLELEQINQVGQLDKLLPILQSSMRHNKKNKYSHAGVTGRIYMLDGVNRNDSFLVKKFQRGRLELPYVQTAYNRSDPNSWNHKNWGDGVEYYKWVNKFAKDICVARHVINDVRVSKEDDSVFNYDIDYFLSSKYPIRMGDLSVHNTHYPYKIEMTDFLFDSNGVYHTKFNLKGSIEKSRLIKNVLTGHSQFKIALFNSSEKQHNWMFIIGDELSDNSDYEISSNDVYLDENNRFSHTDSKVDVISKYPNYNKLGMRASEFYNAYVVSVDFVNTSPAPYLFLAKRLSGTNVQTAVFVSFSMLILLLWFPKYRRHIFYPLTFTLTAYLFLSVMTYYSIKLSHPKITVLIQIVLSAMPLYLLLTYGLLWVKKGYKRLFGREMSSVYNLIVGFFVILINLILAANFIFSISFAALLAYSSVVTIVLGIALRNLIMDAFSGILLSVENAISSSDWVAINNRLIGDAAEGRVLRMCWRSVLLETRSKDIINVPNSIVISSSLRNYCKPSSTTRLRIPIEIDIKHSVDTILNVFSSMSSQEIANKELHTPKIIVYSFEKSAIRYHAFIHYNIADFGPDDARTRFLGVLTKVFEANGIQYSVNKLRLTDDTLV